MRVNNIVTKESTLLESMMLGTDPDTRRALRNMQENFVVPYNKYLNNISRRLTEAELTPDQITQLFGSVTQGAQQAGGNETMLGKMMPDSIKKKFVDSLPAPDAGEVPGFEEKATAAVQQVADPATKQSLMQVIKTGLQNPVTQRLIIAGVQGVAGIAAGALTGGLGGKLGATAAGAITGGLVGLIAAKLQGQDWKTAAKAGLKGAAIGGVGGLAGSVASGVASTALDSIKSDRVDYNTQSTGQTGDYGQPTYNIVQGAQLGVGMQLPDGEVISALDSSNPNSGVTITKPNGSTYTVSRDEAQSLTGQTGISNQANMTGPVSMGAASDPKAGVTDGPKPYSVPAPTGGNQAASDREWAEANADQDAAQALAAGGPRPTIGQSFNSGTAPTGANGQPMQQVPMDEPAAGGQETSADGKPYPEGLSAQQKQIYDNPIQVGSNNTGTVSFTDGTKMEAAFLPPGSITPRFPPNTQKMEFPFDGKMVTGYVTNNKIWFTNFGAPKTESKQIKSNALIEYVDKDLTVRMWALHESLDKPRGGVHLTEAGFGNLIKDIGGWIKTKGQNLTQTVTADKLMQAWKKEGSPTDSEKVAELLTKQGVAPEVIDASYKSMSIPRTAPTGEPGKVEPTMEPEYDTQTGVANDAMKAQNSEAGKAAAPNGFNPETGQPNPAPDDGAAAPAEPEKDPAAAPEPEKDPAAPAGGNSIFADPKKLLASFESFQEADGSLPPAFRGVLKDILLTALRTVESKNRKLNAIIKESKHLQKQVAALKNRKQI